MAESSTTFNQAIGRVKNTWLELMKGIADTGLWKGLVTVIDQVAARSDVLAGLLGAGLGLAFSKLVTSIGAAKTALYDHINTLRLYGTAEQQAAIQAEQEAAAQLKAAEAEAIRATNAERAAASTVKSVQLQVDANQRLVASLIARNAVADEVTLAMNNQNIAQQAYANSLTKLTVAEGELTAARLAEADAIAVGNAAGAAALRQAAQEEATASAALRRATLKVEAIEAEVIALRALSAAGAANAAQISALAVKEEQLLAAREQKTAATLNESAALDRLVLAQQQVVVSGNEELAAAQRVTAARELALATASKEVDANNRRLAIAERNLAGMLAEGGSAEKLAAAQSKLAISQERLDQAKIKSIEATEAQLLAQKRSSEALLAQQSAMNGVASATGLLGKAWNLLLGPVGMVILGVTLMWQWFGRTSEATDALKKSTEEFSESLGKMTAAQLTETHIASQQLVKDLQSQQESLRKESEFLKETNGGFALFSGTLRGVWDSIKVWNSGAETQAQLLSDLEKNTAELNIAQAKMVETTVAMTNSIGPLRVDMSRQADQVAELTKRYEEQRIKVEGMRAAILSSVSLYFNRDAWKELAIAEEQLAIGRRDLEKANGALAQSSATLALTYEQVAKATGISVAEMQAAVVADQSAIEMMSDKSKATVLQIQQSLALNEAIQRLKESLILEKAHYEATKTAGEAHADMLQRVGKASEDVAKQRQGLAEKYVVETQLQQDLIRIGENELNQLEKELALKQQTVGLTDKQQRKNQEEAVSIQAKIEKQKAEIEARQNNMVAMQAEMRQAQIAAETTTASYQERAVAIAEAQENIEALRAAVKRMTEEGVASDAIITEQYRQMAEWEARLTEATQRGGVIRNEAYKRIGQSIQEATTGIRLQTQLQIDALGNLAVSGEATAEKLQKALDDAVNTANSRAEIVLLQQKLIELGDKGRLSPQQIADAFDRLRAKFKEIELSTDPLNRALSQLGVESTGRLDALAKEAGEAFRRIEALKAPVEQTNQAFLKYAESAIKAAAASGEGISNDLRLEAAKRGLGDALDALIVKYPPMNVALTEHNARLQDIVEGIGKYLQANLKLTDSEIAGLKAKQELAALLGKVGLGFQLAYQEAQKYTEQSRKQVDVDKNSVVDLEKKRQRLIDEAGGYQNLTAAQRLSVIEIDKEIVAAKENVRTSETNIEVRRRQEVAARNMANGLGELIRLENLEIQTLETDEKRLLAVASVRERMAKAQLTIAEASGNQEAVAQRQAELDQILIDGAYARAKADQYKSTAARDVLAVTTQNALADGVYTLEEQKLVDAKQQEADAAAGNAAASYEEADATEVTIKAKQKNTKATQEAADAGGSFAQVLASQIQYWRDVTGELSKATQGLFEFKAGFTDVDPRLGQKAFGAISEEAAIAANKIADLGKYIRSMQDAIVTSAGPISELFAKINEAGAEAQQSYYEQKLAAEQLEARLKQVGETGGRSFGSVASALSFVNGQATNAIDQFTLLNEEDLSNLRSSIDDARNKIKELKDETQSARDRLAQLDADIAAAKGESKRADLLRQQLEYQQSLRDLELEMEKARAENNLDYLALLEKQKLKLEELNRLQVKNIDEQYAGTKNANESVQQLNAGLSQAKASLAEINNIDLSKVGGQLGTLHETVTNINRALA